MTTQPKRTVAFALCGSFCSFSAVLPQVRLLAARGWDVLPILSASAAGQDTRFGVWFEPLLPRLCPQREF